MCCLANECKPELLLLKTQRNTTQQRKPSTLCNTVLNVNNVLLTLLMPLCLLAIFLLFACFSAYVSPTSLFLLHAIFIASFLSSIFLLWYHTLRAMLPTLAILLCRLPKWTTIVYTEVKHFLFYLPSFLLYAIDFTAFDYVQRRARLTSTKGMLCYCVYYYCCCYCWRHCKEKEKCGKL